MWGINLVANWKLTTRRPKFLHAATLNGLHQNLIYLQPYNVYNECFCNIIFFSLWNIFKQLTTLNL